MEAISSTELNNNNNNNNSCAFLLYFIFHNYQFTCCNSKIISQF